MRVEYSRPFQEAFVRKFHGLCAGHQGPPEFWTDDTAWTKFILRDERCFLSDVVNDWANQISLHPFSIEKEWLKFDLLVISPGQSPGKEWWRSIPIAAIEHENGDGIHDEIWKLACWRARLKVLVTYHRDDDVLHAKLDKAREIIRSVEAVHGPEAADWLFLSAPRTFKGADSWVARTWISADWTDAS